VISKVVTDELIQPVKVFQTIFHALHIWALFTCPDVLLVEFELAVKTFLYRLQIQFLVVAAHQFRQASAQDPSVLVGVIEFLEEEISVAFFTLLFVDDEVRKTDSIVKYRLNVLSDWFLILI